MEQVLSILNSKEISYIFFFFIFSSWMVIKKNLQSIYFFILKIFGRLGEKKARMLLKKNGYEILEEQLP